MREDLPTSVIEPSTTTALRIVTWNANMAVHRKLPILCDRLHPDVAIVPECAINEVVRRKGGADLPDFSMDWVGRPDKPNKGLAVLGFGDYMVRRAEAFDARLQWVLPIEVDGPIPFNLIAVWAGNHRARIQHPDHHEVPQGRAALAVYSDWIAERPTVVAGDFNHNVIWDKPGKEHRHHGGTVADAEAAGLVSAYHHWFEQEQGQETTPTHYWRDRTIDGPSYHIDYVFTPAGWPITAVDLGSFDDWIGSGLSDHVPLTVDLEVPTTAT